MPQLSLLFATIVGMTKLTSDDVFKLAALARIAITDEEVDVYSQELTAILEYVEQLASVDVSELKPTNQVTGLTNVMRADVVKDYGYAPQDLLHNTPQTSGNLLKVKRMIG